jgi:hypothetical protein
MWRQPAAPGQAAAKEPVAAITYYGLGLAAPVLALVVYLAMHAVRRRLASE